MFPPYETPHTESSTTPRQVGALARTILVVDGDDDTREQYRQSFALAGWDVVEASDGREALTKALIRPPTLVVTETRLRFVDGYALCEILRRDRTTADVPILVVTAESRPVHIERARNAGADGVLIKPTTPEQLWTETQRLVADARAMRVHAATARTNAVAQRDPGVHKTKRLSKAFSRFTTTTPPAKPPSLVCPTCDVALTYEDSHIGGVNDRHAEQWDRYDCPACWGTFQYRQRTRKLRRIS